MSVIRRVIAHFWPRDSVQRAGASPGPGLPANPEPVEAEVSASSGSLSLGTRTRRLVRTSLQREAEAHRASDGPRPTDLGPPLPPARAPRSRRNAGPPRTSALATQDGASAPAPECFAYDRFQTRQRRCSGVPPASELNGIPTNRVVPPLDRAPHARGTNRCGNPRCRADAVPILLAQSRRGHRARGGFPRCA